MNSASMATNLLGRAVRLRDKPVGSESDRGYIVLVSIDSQGVHFLVEAGGRLILVESCDQMVVLQ
jgi:hypothetical protein